jgi:GNAT superfamily N-acetyltransferase
MIVHPNSPSAATFREITATDVPALFHVRPRTRENAMTLEELQRLGIDPQSVAKSLAGSTKGWLCEVGGEVVAFAMADRATGEFLVIAVLPEHEGKGIGGTLMATTQEWLAASGCTRAWLTTDLDTRLRAYGFYRKHGWTDWKIERGLRWMETRFPAHIRDIDPASTAEVNLVAQRMRETLIEVEGFERGSSMYTMDWLAARVRWHLDREACRGRVLLAEMPGRQIAGHTIIRIEQGEAGPFGLVSTTYVDPAFRRAGVASALLGQSERWFAEQGVPSCCTWTSSTNARLISMYERQGYAITESGANDLTGTLMVKLSKIF